MVTAEIILHGKTKHMDECEDDSNGSRCIAHCLVQDTKLVVLAHYKVGAPGRGATNLGGTTSWTRCTGSLIISDKWRVGAGARQMAGAYYPTALEQLWWIAGRRQTDGG